MTTTQLIILHTHFYCHYSSSSALFGYFFFFCLFSFDRPALFFDLLCSSLRVEHPMVLFEECLALLQRGGAVEGELHPERLFLFIASVLAGGGALRHLPFS